MHVESLGFGLFAVTMVGLGVVGFVRPDVVGVWQVLAGEAPARGALGDLCAVVCLVSGLGLLWPRVAGHAARLLLVFLLVWILVFRVPAIIRAPVLQDCWSACGETAVVAAAAWVLYAWFAPDWDRGYLGFATGARGLRIARVFYGLAMIPFGTAHFVYLKETVGLVPAWLPFHFAWAYFTGSAFVLAGIAVLIGIWAKWAAALSALQLGLFTLLVWGPILAAGSTDVSSWSETVISWVLTVSALVVADPYATPR